MPEFSPALYRAGEGEPLVLLHGFTGTWHHWRPVIADLVPRFEVIAPTLAGHDGGPHFPTDQPLTIEHAGNVLEGHLDELGVQTAHFAGNSLGGALTLEMAKRGRARSAVALCPGGGWSPGHPESLRLAKFFARQQKLMRATQKRTHIVMRRPGSRKLALRDAMLHGELVAPDEATSLVHRALACRITDNVIDALQKGVAVMDGLEKVSCPTLVAVSPHDRILPMEHHFARFRDEIPNVETLVMQGVGHVPMWDAPQQTARVIADFALRHAGAEAPAPAAAA